MELYNIYKNKINLLLQTEITDNIEYINIKEALILALKDGKRLRPIISLLISQNINEKYKTNYNLNNLIIVSELIHTASLIIDDLPCMDNDLFRRNNPTIHNKYGERSAQILTMYLMSNVFSLFYSNLESLRSQGIPNFKEREKIMTSTLVNTLGIKGAALGQYQDITNNKSLNKNDITTLIEKKTGTFFEIAFVLGFIGSGGDILHISNIKKASYHFGVAFQISDDFEDIIVDKKRDGCPNFINYVGNDISKSTFYENINKCKEILIELDIYNNIFKEIFEILYKRVK